jgi:hypothetical protein
MAEETNTALVQDVKKILFLLESNESLGQEGLIKKVNRIDATLAELLVREKIYRIKATTWGAIAGVIAGASTMGVKAIAVKLMAIFA